MADYTKLSITPAGGAVATDAIWDAKGDLAVGTGADTAAKLTVGANDTVLVAASGEATGAKWSATLAGLTLTSPKIGTAITDTSGNEVIITPATASAVNEVTITNAATNTAPKVSATGGDTNISLDFISKGTGGIMFNSAGVAGADGWIPALTSVGVVETWTYATASTITVPAGAASKYAVGDRIKWTQTTVKYGVITVVADTLLTIAVNTDYVVTNAAITANYYSHAVSPVGFPHWFNLAAPTFDVGYYDNGAGGQPTTTVHRMSITGRTVSLNYGGSGTKAGTNPYIVISASTMPTPINQGETVAVLGAGHMTDAYQGNFCLSTNPYIVICPINIPDNTAINDFTYKGVYEI